MQKQELQYIHSFAEYIDRFLKLLIDYSPKMISAFVILFLGLYAIRVINRLVKKIMLKRELDPTLSKFLADSLLWALRVLLFISVISKLGIETSSFVAILGAAGLAIGLSLQGSLSNFAGGMLIILFKPFRLGDTIEAHGETGKVAEILIFSTKLITATNQVIYIPNGILSNGKIKNYSQLGIRRADLILKTSYQSNFSEIKSNILSFVATHELILQEPKPEVLVNELSETTIVFVVKVWTNNADFAKVSSDILEFSKTVVKL